MQLFNRLKSLMPSLFWLVMVIVSILLLIELPPHEGGWPYWDKVQHVTVFLGLTVIGLLAHPFIKNKMIIGLAVYGGMAEILQGLFTITRMPSMLDWVADLVGIALAVTIIYAITSRR
jgi:VanZ family protein